jgi:hypothetical protein
MLKTENEREINKYALGTFSVEYNLNAFDSNESTNSQKRTVIKA